jgi:hypothetical protein
MNDKSVEDLKEKELPILFLDTFKPLKVNNNKVTCQREIVLYGKGIPPKEEKAILEKVPDKDKDYFITTDISFAFTNYSLNSRLIDFEVTNVNFHPIKTKYNYKELFLIDNGFLPKQSIPLFFIKNKIYKPIPLHRNIIK